MLASGHFWSSSLHTYQSARRFVRSCRDSWNHGCWSLVWFITRSAMMRMPRPVRLLDQLDDVAQVAVLGQHREEVADVVPAVAQGRLVEGQQPEAVDAEPAQVVELLDNTLEVAAAVVVRVEEAADEYLVEDGALVPAAPGCRTSAAGERRFAGALLAERRDADRRILGPEHICEQRGLPIETGGQRAVEAGVDRLLGQCLRRRRPLRQLRRPRRARRSARRRAQRCDPPDRWRAPRRRPPGAR